MEDQAYQTEKVSDGASQLSRFSETSWEDLADKLALVRENVNDMGKELARLEDLRPTMPAAEQEEIDQITPVLQNLASHTEAAITQLNQHELTFWSTNLPDDLGNIYRGAKQVNGSVASFERSMKGNNYQRS